VRTFYQDNRGCAAREAIGSVVDLTTRRSAAFSASDADLQLAEPRVFLNGTRKVPTGTGMRSVRGPLVWIYFPEHDRYSLSLAPRAGFDFKKAGEVRGTDLHHRRRRHQARIHRPDGLRRFRLHDLRPPRPRLRAGFRTPERRASDRLGQRRRVIGPKTPVKMIFQVHQGENTKNNGGYRRWS